MDRERIERLIAPASARRTIRPADEPARKRLRVIAGPIGIARRHVSLDPRRTIRLAGSIATSRKGTIGGQ